MEPTSWNLHRGIYTMESHDPIFTMEPTPWNLHDGICTMESTRWNTHKRIYTIDGIYTMQSIRWKLHDRIYTMESTQWNPHNAIISITYVFRRIWTSHIRIFPKFEHYFFLHRFRTSHLHVTPQTLCTTDFLRSITKNAFRSGSTGCTSRGHTSQGRT